MRQGQGRNERERAAAGTQGNEGGGRGEWCSADKAAKALEEERTARRKQEARVEEIEQELKDAIATCESLEQKSSEQASELTKALESLKEARVDAQGTRQEI